MRNKYRVEGDIAYIEVVKRSGESFDILIDALSIGSILEGPSIYLNSKSSYPVIDYWENNKNKHVYLHRLLTNAGKGEVVDHLNHNVLDNRLCNLKVTTVSNNMNNRAGAAINSKSGIRGISWHKKGNKWMVQTQIEKQYYYIGLFSDIDEARAAMLEFRRDKGLDDLYNKGI